MDAMADGGNNASPEERRDEGLALNVMNVSVVNTRRLCDEIVRHHTTAVDAGGRCIQEEVRKRRK